MTLILNGTDNSATTPAVTGTDTDTGVYYPAANQVALATGGTLALIVDSSQNVGIGTNTPSAKSQVNATNFDLTNSYSLLSSNFAVRTTNAQGANIGGEIALGGFNNTAATQVSDFVRLHGKKTNSTSTNVSGYFAVEVAYDGGPAPYMFERMRIHDNGLVTFGSITPTFSMPTLGGMSIKSDNTGGGSPIVEIGNTNSTSGSDGSPALICFKNSATTNSNARFIQFSASGAGTTMGAIVGAGSGVCAFANFSDVSLKKNIQPLSGSLAKILALKPSSYDMISDNSHVNAGLIAQDVQEVYPEYVVENMSDEGKPPLMGITGGLSGGFISELICAIQELKAEFDAYKASHP